MCSSACVSVFPRRNVFATLSMTIAAWPAGAAITTLSSRGAQATRDLLLHYQQQVPRSARNDKIKPRSPRSLRGDKFVRVKTGPGLRRLQVPILLEQIERLIPIGLRAPTDAALRVRRIEELDVDLKLLQRRLPAQIGLHLDRSINRCSRILFCLFP